MGLAISHTSSQRQHVKRQQSYRHQRKQTRSFFHCLIPRYTNDTFFFCSITFHCILEYTHIANHSCCDGRDDDFIPLPKLSDGGSTNSSTLSPTWNKYIAVDNLINHENKEDNNMNHKFISNDQSYPQSYLFPNGHKQNPDAMPIFGTYYHWRRYYRNIIKKLKHLPTLPSAVFDLILSFQPFDTRELILVRDNMGLWCIAEILEIKFCDDDKNNECNQCGKLQLQLQPAMLRVHYLGWTLMLDEWISVEEYHRICKIKRKFSLNCMSTIYFQHFFVVKRWLSLHEASFFFCYCLFFIFIFIFCLIFLHPQHYH